MNTIARFGIERLLTCDTCGRPSHVSRRPRGGPALEQVELVEAPVATSRPDQRPLWGRRLLPLPDIALGRVPVSGRGDSAVAFLDECIRGVRQSRHEWESALRRGTLCPWQGDHTGCALPGLVDCIYPGRIQFGGVIGSSMRANHPTGHIVDSFPLRSGEDPMPVFWPDPTGRHVWRGFLPAESPPSRFSLVLFQLVPGFAHGVSAPWTPTHLVADDDRPITSHDGGVHHDPMGWFADPCATAELRFFSGVEWTHWVADGGLARPTAPSLGTLHTGNVELDDELGLRSGVSAADLVWAVNDYLDD